MDASRVVVPCLEYMLEMFGRTGKAFSSKITNSQLTRFIRSETGAHGYLLFFFSVRMSRFYFELILFLF
jgi:hypothetical protein